MEAAATMKFQFKHQQFQADAAEAICDVFNGQQRQSEKFFLTRADELIIGANAPLNLTDEQLLKNLRGVQMRNGLPISERLDGRNFSVEMETGVGKTYTYIKTMYELNRRYGWSKFIVIVPSVAIREGVRKTFEVTAEHFAKEYGERIRYFVYNSKNPSEIRNFVSDVKIWAMIINVQAFNRKNDTLRINKPYDEFQSQIPLTIISRTRPIIILDEPQSLEGKVTRQKMPEFKPLMTLRYSATHKEIFNQVYKLDALDAYQRRLVKKIAVVGTEIRGEKFAGYVYFERINFSRGNPTATVRINRRNKGAIKKVTRKISAGDDLFKLSGEMDDYRNFIVTDIDGAESSIEFLNGLKLFIGQVVGDTSEENFRRIQIRETIKLHLERESQLFGRGIKVLSLFFIDEVAKYRTADNSPAIYTKIFEEEYAEIAKDFATSAEHRQYLDAIAAQETHAGYFAVDKKNRAVNSDSDDAYDLIMRNKERLLDFRTPVRFIFSHSALREGWDNPNVFQICALKQSSSDTRRRQEVGRGMRLCVNQNGERMDEERIGGEVHDVNILTVIANESYNEFAKGLQREIAEAVNRPAQVDEKFFIGRKISGQIVDERQSRKIYNALIRSDYLDDDGNLTEKFFADAANDTLAVDTDIAKILQGIGGEYKISDARSNVTAKFDEQKFHSETFRQLWANIKRKAFYRVAFDSHKPKEIAAELNRKLIVPENYAVIERGTLNDTGNFDMKTSRTENFQSATTPSRTDLVGKLVTATGLTRRDVTEILRELEPKIFTFIERDIEKFLRDAAKIINDTAAEQITDAISYTPASDSYDEKIFLVPISGRLNDNAVATAKNLYDYLIYDSKREKDFAADMDASDSVALYVKLPRGFVIPTPQGKYNPDWAIVLRKGAVQKIYFVVETKGSVDENQLRGVESHKIFCAKKYFNAIAGDNIKYNVAATYRELEDILQEEFK